jgi:hypothetical protein
MTQESESTSDSARDNLRRESAYAIYLRKRMEDDAFRAAYERAMSELRNGHDS